MILGGDLNMRDKEVVSVGGLPAGVTDVWEQLGCRPAARYIIHDNVSGYNRVIMNHLSTIVSLCLTKHLFVRKMSHYCR